MKANNEINQSNTDRDEVIVLQEETFLQKLWSWIFENKVMLLFLVICVGAIAVAGNSASFVVENVATRFGRNAFTVMSLLIPVLAGLGLNFSIVIGAIAAQMGLFFAVDWGFTGITGMLIAFLIATPLASLFGFGVGRLFNKMKGSEMIAGLILGYFADGLYQLFFLYILGGVLPVKTESLIIPGGIGIKNTIDLTGNMKYALDDIKLVNLVLVLFIIIAVISVFRIVRKLKDKEESPLKDIVVLLVAALAYGLSYVPAIESALMTSTLSLLNVIVIVVVGGVAYGLWKLLKNKLNPEPKFNTARYVFIILALGALYAVTYLPELELVLMNSTVPALPLALIAGLSLFNAAFLSTRIGQNMRTVGQSRVIANASGINVDRVRVLAMIISTVLASWGQLIYLQNLGTFATYGAHLQVGQFAIAALLVGGASVSKATNKQAITGVLLFHTLFIVAPEAGKVLFNNAMIGEYFRVFVSYGVIALALAMHAWQRKKKPALEMPA
ncbi:MAG: ABC transporter permease [Eubacteriales bacterium]|nr:ABC transporter permease [Eubacteriales bacterium]